MVSWERGNKIFLDYRGLAGIRIGILLTFISFPNYNNVIAGHLTKSDTTTTDMSLRSTQLSASSQEFKFPTPGMLTDLNWKPITFSRSGLLWCLSRNSMSLDAGMFWVTILWFKISSIRRLTSCWKGLSFFLRYLSSFRNGFQSGTRWSYQAAQMLRRQRSNKTKRVRCMT